MLLKDLAILNTLVINNMIYKKQKNNYFKLFFCFFNMLLYKSQQNLAQTKIVLYKHHSYKVYKK